MPRISQKKEPLSEEKDVSRKASGDSETQESDNSPQAQLDPFVTVLKREHARKLSPRGEGDIIYMVGVFEGKIHLRIVDNGSGGRHSKEWVPLDAIRQKTTASMRAGNAFKSSSFTEFFKGRSNNNSGFLVAILRKEGVFVADKEKPHLTRLASAEAFGVWEKDILNMPRPRNAEQVPLHPPRPDHLFKKKGKEAEPKEKSVSLSEETV